MALAPGMLARSENHSLLCAGSTATVSEAHWFKDTRAHISETGMLWASVPGADRVTGSWAKTSTHTSDKNSRKYQHQTGLESENVAMMKNVPLHSLGS